MPYHEQTLMICSARGCLSFSWSRAIFHKLQPGNIALLNIQYKHSLLMSETGLWDPCQNKNGTVGRSRWANCCHRVWGRRVEVSTATSKPSRARCKGKIHLTLLRRMPISIEITCSTADSYPRGYSPPQIPLKWGNSLDHDHQYLIGLQWATWACRMTSSR